MGGYILLDIFIGNPSKKFCPLYSISAHPKTHYQPQKNAVAEQTIMSKAPDGLKDCLALCFVVLGRIIWCISTCGNPT